MITSALLASATKSTSQNVLAGSAEVYLVTDLDLTFTLAAAADVEISYNIFVYKAINAESSRAMFYEVDYDGVSDRVWTLLRQENISFGHQWAGAFTLTLAAGTHTVEFGASASVYSIAIISADYDMLGWYPVSMSWAKTVLRPK